MSDFLLCSNCFKDEGLKIYSSFVGKENNQTCINCKTNTGKKLNLELLEHVVYMFFVKGTVKKFEYGAAPIIQFNDKRDCEIKSSGNLKYDIELLEKNIKLGLFYYGPKLWMLGEIEPLKKLLNKEDRPEVFKRIVTEFPVVSLKKGIKFYRLRINPNNHKEHKQYDSPPKEYLNTGRFDSSNLPVLYASQDIDVCIHECRITVEDELYLATLKTEKELKLLDLTEIIKENCDEFESLDLAIHFLFFAGKYSYEISRDLAQFIFRQNYDGIIYPSYFSSIRNGIEPYQTIYGMSIRGIEQLQKYAKSQITGNIALFGYPIENELIHVHNINKLVLNKIKYDYSFGPVDF